MGKFSGRGGATPKQNLHGYVKHCEEVGKFSIMQNTASSGPHPSQLERRELPSAAVVCE